MTTVVPIIDIFAGPGGLGEGFSQLKDDKLKFKIALSVATVYSSRARDSQSTSRIGLEHLDEAGLDNQILLRLT